MSDSSAIIQTSFFVGMIWLLAVNDIYPTALLFAQEVYFYNRLTGEA